MGRRGRKPRPALERAMEKIEVRGPDECWPWTGRSDEKGYGLIDNTRASRVVLGLAPGDPLVARHKCDNPPCCNPAHLVPGTHAENMADMKSRGRSPRGELRPNAKLSAAQVNAIRADPRSGHAIARDYGTSADLIVKIKRGERWAHVPVTGPVALPTRFRFDAPSPRQMQVLDGLARGLTLAEISVEIGITKANARIQQQRLFRKLDVRNRAHAAVVGQRLGLTGSPETVRDASARLAEADRVLTHPLAREYVAALLAELGRQRTGGAR